MADNGRRWTFRVGFFGLALVTGFWTIFAALSGAEELGGGWRGLWRNAPNALPWLLALGGLVFAFVRPFAGGLLFVLLGLLSVVHFDTWQHAFTFAMITAPYLGFGCLVAISGWLDRPGR